MMRALVCGGRDFADADKAYRVLDDLRASKKFPITLVIHGAQRGADSLAAMWADERGVPVESFPAQWKTHGKAAGPIRNQQMLDEGKPDFVVAFPGGVGTADMVRRSRAAKLPVVTVP